MSARLTHVDKAEKEILKLPRAVKGAIYEFEHKFRQNPHTSGLRFKALKEHPNLFSARITDDYRALLFRAAGEEYFLVAVKPRGEVYENLDRYKFEVNAVSGGIEFMDIVHLSSFGGQVRAEIGPSSHTRPLFAAYPPEQLAELGVAQALLPLVAKITDEDELLGLMEYAPQLTVEVLSALRDGMSPDDVMEQVTDPVRAQGPVDVTDFEKAAARPATQVTTDDSLIREALDKDFARWKVFLHPVQRLIVERHYNGPARVSGGPGTGKTIVALHRVRHLVRQLPAGSGKEVLFTTFNKNLAAHLRDRLLDLGGPELVARVDVVHIDSLATKVAAEAEPGVRRHFINDQGKAVELWQQTLTELGETAWTAEFLFDEWSQVILGHAVRSRDDYFRVRRAGRGRKINRVQRAEIWQLVEQFTKRMAEQGLWTFPQLAAHAAQLERDRAGRSGHRYAHVVVDEAQDLSPAHWMLLRAMVAEGPNDMFIAGDTHQRIYDNYVSLGSLGIAIRGRSSRLTLSYRSTHEILAAGEALLGTEEWDDLDGGTDTLKGYRSVLHGPRPVLKGYGTWPDELDALVTQVKQWQEENGPASSIGIAVPVTGLIGDVADRLRREGIPATTIGKEGPRSHDPVHIGTLHRFKGLEYQHMLVTAATDGLIPSTRIAALKTADPHRYAQELKRARSLLFVAATRARDSLTLTWHGTPSPFLPGPAAP